ncbi:MAG: FtsH protease activity modulator HflK [Planctomycetota bacterium]|jgi:membrane protease subunit HflK
MRPRDPRDFPVPDFKLPDINLPGALAAALLLLLLVGLWSAFFTVEPEEVGVVLTFGEYSREADPGLRFKFPYPFQTVIKVPVQRQLKEEFGFRTERVGVRSTFTGKKDEAQMLTGDLNVVIVEWTTQFRVNDPYKFLFKVRNLRETFRDINQAVMRAVVGDRSVTEVLTIGRQEIASEVEVRLQELCDQYETGLKIEQVVLQDVNPPEEVKPSFNEVNQAQQERERMINEARTAFNRIIPKARGEAQQTIQEAEGYATDRVNRAKGDAARFKALLEAYRKAPEVTRRRIYLETMQRILPGVQRTIVLDQDLKGLMPLLSLQGEVTP